MEVTTALPSLRSKDIRATAALISRAVGQATSLRDQIAAGSVQPRFPAGWPSDGDVSWSWVVGHPREFDPGGDSGLVGLPVLSPLVFDSFAPFRDLTDALARLVRPVLPDGYDYRVNNRVHRETAAVPAQRLVVERRHLHVVTVESFALALGEERPGREPAPSAQDPTAHDRGGRVPGPR